VSKSLFVAVLWAQLAVFIVPGACAAGNGLNLQEGYWETMVTIAIQGGILPVPAIKSGKCITRGDPLPNAVESSAMHCRVFDKAVSGNDVSWRLECHDEKGKMEGRAKITYRGDKFNGKMDALVTQSEGDHRARLEYVMKGERVRDCKKTDPQ
jgi:hypothetical protein